MNDTSILYRHYDAHGRLLYVGVAVNPKKRLLGHAGAGAVWVTDVARSTYERFRTYKEVLAAEVQAIKTESPIWNILHSSSLYSSTRILTMARMSRSTDNELCLPFPDEPCFARKGVLVSFHTRGPANHVTCALVNDNCERSYSAVLAWMEWFSYHYDNGYVIADDGTFRADWLSVLRIVNQAWHYEFVHRPLLGFESAFSEFGSPLPMAGIKTASQGELLLE